MNTQNPAGVVELAMSLPPDEKLYLIQCLAQSLQGRESRTVEEQKKALEALKQELATLPVGNPNDGLSGRDHDRILYGDRS